MKKMLTAVLISTALLTSAFAYSSDVKPGNSVTKEVPVKSTFKKIEMGNNMQLVLLQDATITSISITGDENIVKDIKVTIEKGVLFVTSKKEFRNKEIKIYVPVNMLTSIDLGRGTSVANEGIVKLDGLKITVHVGSKVNLHVIGDFDVESGDDCDFVFEKYEKSSVVYVHE
jgi:hypothetical protein